MNTARNRREWSTATTETVLTVHVNVNKLTWGIYWTRTGTGRLDSDSGLLSLVT